MSMITQQEVKDLFDYDPDTGECRWKVKRKKAKPGAVIGDEYIYDTGYKMVSSGRRTYMLHRLIWLWMTGETPERSVKHINGDRADNRWENLVVTSSTPVKQVKKEKREPPVVEKQDIEHPQWYTDLMSYTQVN